MCYLSFEAIEVGRGLIFLLLRVRHREVVTSYTAHHNQPALLYVGAIIFGIKDQEIALILQLDPDNQLSCQPRHKNNHKKLVF